MASQIIEEVNQLVKLGQDIATVADSIKKEFSNQEEIVKIQGEIIEQHGQELVDLKSDCDGLEYKFNELEMKCDDLENKYDDLEMRCDDPLDNNDDLEMRCDDLEMRCDELETKCDVLENKCDDLEIKYDDLQAKYDRIIQMLSQQNALPILEQSPNDGQTVHKSIPDMMAAKDAQNK